MRRHATEELPFALEERRAIYHRAVVLSRSVFDVRPAAEPWRPPHLIDEIEVSPALPSLEAGEAQMEIARPFLEFNDRLTNAASAVMSMAVELKLAGLKQKDLDLWKANAHSVSGEQSGKSASKNEDRELRIVGSEYVGEFTCGISAPEWTQVRRRLEVAGGLFSRTATAVSRILQTVGPDGILDRLTVDLASNSASFDGNIYAGLTEHETTLLHYLRLGVGEWVGSPRIAAAERLTQLKVAPCRKSLAERHPVLGRIIHSKRGSGVRLVLPLPRQ